MKARLIAIGRWFLLIWGAISLVGTLAFVGLCAYQFHEENDKASTKSVSFVLNWCELGDERIKRVVHSHVSGQALQGDHLDAYAIEITHVEVAELTRETDDSRTHWYRGDRMPPIVGNAVALADPGQEASWFPRTDELRSSEFYIYPWSMRLHGVEITAADLIFVRPSERMVYYLSFQN